MTDRPKKNTAPPVPSGNVIPLRRRNKAPCPICRKASDPQYSPFCSKRCADIDLHHWLGESYRVPAEEPAGEEDA
jgi:uncharacterized protein